MRLSRCSETGLWESWTRLECRLAVLQDVFFEELRKSPTGQEKLLQFKYSKEPRPMKPSKVKRSLSRTVVFNNS